MLFLKFPLFAYRPPEKSFSPVAESTLLNPISRYHVRSNVSRAESSASILIPTNGIAVEYILYIVGILVWRDVVTRQFPMTILLCLRVPPPTSQPASQPTNQPALNAREINRFAVIQRINPLETTKPLAGTGRGAIEWPDTSEWPRVRLRKTRRRPGERFFSLIYGAEKPDEKNS